MNGKERARAAMRREKPDRVPVIPQICEPHAVLTAGLPYEDTLLDRLRHPEKYVLLVGDCAARYGVDGFRVFLTPPPRNVRWLDGQAYSINPETGQKDGIVDFKGGGGLLRLPEHKRTLTHADVDAVEVAPADELIESPALEGVRQAVAAYGDDYFVIGAPGEFTVETLSHVQGVEATLTDIHERPDFIKAWAERHLAKSIQYALAMAHIGVSGIYIGDTFGQFMTPEQFQELCLPYFQRFVEAVRPSGVLIYLHMCGRVTHLIDFMPETGVDCVEPLDVVGGTPVEEVVRRIGGRVALMGGVSTLLLSSGTIDEVRQDCARCIELAGRDGGYILAACDMLPTETSPDKVRTMLEVAETAGRYDFQEKASAI